MLNLRLILNFSIIKSYIENMPWTIFIHFNCRFFFQAKRAAREIQLIQFILSRKSIIVGKIESFFEGLAG